MGGTGLVGRPIERTLGRDGRRRRSGASRSATTTTTTTTTATAASTAPAPGGSEHAAERIDHESLDGCHRGHAAHDHGKRQRSDGTIFSVSFYANGVFLKTDGAGPYSMQWSNPAPGTYVLTAVAADDKGGTTTSAPVTVTVKKKK